MQTLYFEPAWDKTISPADREKIVSLFNEQVIHPEAGVHFSFLWEALNHKEEQLVTVLMHNLEDRSLSLQDTTISYYKQNKQIANGIFHLPCKIPGKTTMPWTFIFSSTNQTTKIPQYQIIFPD